MKAGFCFLRHALNSFMVTLLSFLIMTTCLLLQLKSSCLSVVWFTINHQERILKIPDEDQKKFNEKYLNKMKECEVASRMNFFILFWVYNESAYCICVIECKISWFLLVHYYSIYLIILNKKLEIWVWTKYWYRSQDLVPSFEDLLVWTSVPPFPISYLALKLHLNFYIEAFPMNTDH